MKTSYHVLNRNTGEITTFKVGEKYNWIGQRERLIYLGYKFSGNGYWHQFAKVDQPQVVWCEVQGYELSSFEATKE